MDTNLTRQSSVYTKSKGVFTRGRWHSSSEALMLSWVDLNLDSLLQSRKRWKIFTLTTRLMLVYALIRTLIGKMMKRLRQKTNRTENFAILLFCIINNIDRKAVAAKPHDTNYCSCNGHRDLVHDRSHYRRVPFQSYDCVSDNGHTHTHTKTSCRGERNLHMKSPMGQ